MTRDDIDKMIIDIAKRLCDSFDRRFEEREKKKAALIELAKKSIKHPHFQYAVVDVDKEEIAYRTKKWRQWLSGEREAYVKASPTTVSASSPLRKNTNEKGGIEMNIREIITKLNVARSSSVTKEKSEEIKEIIQSLIPYAEAEEELGCDLRVYVKMTVGTNVFTKDKDLGILEQRFANYSYSEEHKCFCVCIFGSKTPIFYVKDHGITWALTKEELK